MASRKNSRAPEFLVGLDFGTTKVCAVVGKVTADGLEIVGVGKQPSLGIRKGVVVNIPMTVEAVRKAVEAAELMAGCEISSAIAGIAGSHIKGFNSTGVVAIKNREVTHVDVERAIDAAKAITVPVDREILHLIPQEFTINDQDGVKDPVGMSGVRLESRVHIVTGAVSSAQNIVKCASQAGVSISDIVLESLASAESTLSYDEKELGVVMIDIGGGTTDIALFTRGSVVHTAVIAMGGNHITNDIAVGLRTSIQDAENIKLVSGCAMASMLHADEVIQVPSAAGKKSREVSRSVLAKIIEPRVEEILTLVAHEIASSGYKHLLATGAVITGGASLLEGVPELAEFILELPVRRGSPQGVSGLSDVVNSPIYSTAVGLLLHGTRSRSENGHGLRDDAPIYSRIVGKMRGWFGEVF